MTLKQLYENCISKEIVNIIYEYIHKPYSYQATHCFEEYIEDFEQCKMCKKWFESEHLEDTEGVVDGDIGKVCEDCRGDM